MYTMRLWLITISLLLSAMIASAVSGPRGFSAEATAINFYFNQEPTIFSGTQGSAPATVQITVVEHGTFIPDAHTHPSWTVSITGPDPQNPQQSKVVGSVTFTHPGPYTNANVSVQLPSAGGTYTYTASLTSGEGTPASVNDTAVIDTTPPTISNPTPTPDSTVTTDRPTISADVADSQAGLAWATLDLDGSRVQTTSFNRDQTGHVTFTPTQGLTGGEHNVYVSAGDYVGNYSNLSWKFKTSGWKPNPAITGWITSPTNNTSVNASASIQVELGNLLDNDTKTNPDGTSTAIADQITSVTWSASAGSFGTQSDTRDGNNSITQSTVTWTAPATPPGVEGWVVITATVNDAGVVTPPEVGSRDDTPLQCQVVVKVTGTKTWEAGTGITGEITWPPQSQPELVVAKGGVIHCRAIGSDIDHWTRQAPQPTSGDADDEITYQWSASAGSISAYQGYATWTAPATPPAPDGRVTITVTLDDTAQIPQGDTGNRNDSPLTKQVVVQVVNTPTIERLTTDPTNPITSGQNENATLTFTANINNISGVPVTRAEFSALGQTGTVTIGNDSTSSVSWTINPVPVNESHETKTATCTIYWDTPTAGSHALSKDFKLFFDKNGHDEVTSTDRGFNWDGTPLSPPNWFDSTANHWGAIVPNLSQTWYVDGAGSGTFYYSENFYGLPRGSIIILPAAAGSITPQPGYVYTAPVRGIDACGAVVKHEFMHKTIFEAAWGGYADNQIGPGGAWVLNLDDSGYDLDKDYIKDSWESDDNNSYYSEFGEAQPDLSEIDEELLPSYAYWLNQQYDGNSFENDNEFLADMKGARAWQIGSLDSQDWATYGKQSDPAF